MKSSGIRRGLALAAVSAVAAVGLLPLAANANPMEDQQDFNFTNKTVTIFDPNPGSSQATVKNDGYNTTITLEAAATSDIDTVRFQVSTDAGATWVNINGVLTSPNDDGAWTIEWNPTADSGISLPAAGVLVRAVGHSTLDGLNHPGTSATLAVTSTQDTPSLAPGTQLGVWKANSGDHNVILSGKSSYNGLANLGPVDQSNGFLTFASDPSGVGITVAPGGWKKVLDISGYMARPDEGYNAPDQVAFGIVNNAGPFATDTEAYTIYNQVITTVNVSASPENPANPATQVPVTVTLLDQFNKPIAGANVSSDKLLAPNIFNQIGTTNEDGVVDTSGAPGLQLPTQAKNDGTVQYVGNVAAGDQNAYDPALGDLLSAKTLGQAFSSDLVGSSADGSAFDFDEQDANDIQVQVKDASNGNFDVGNPPSTQALTYHWTKTPFFFNETIVGTSHTLNVETNGKYDIPVLNGADFSFGLEPGTYKLFASLSEGGTGHPVAEKQVLSVKVGEARVQADDVIVPVGTTASVPAQLVLEDGTPLPGRKVNVAYNVGVEYNEHGIPTGTPDAVLVSNTPDTTNGSGNFTPMVEDLSTDPNEPELGGDLTFTSAVSSFGDWNGGAVSDSPQVDFVSTTAPAGAKLNVEYGAGVVPSSITDTGNADSSGPAGSAQGGGLLLLDSANDPLVGVQVTLTVDHGFFVPVGSPNKAPAAGDYVPTPDSLGTSITVVTGTNGRASFNTSIGRDLGFDDDGNVTAKVTGTISAATDNDTNVWNSGTSAVPPLNVSEITVTRTPGEPEIASTDNGVLYDVYAKDQFGNPARGVDVDIECTLELGDDDLCPTGAVITTESDLDNGGDVLLVSNEDGTFEYSAVAVNPTTFIYDNNLVPQPADPTTTFQQEWYTPTTDPNQGATYTIDPLNPSTPVPVDEPVTVTVEALDQQDNPLTGLVVQFVRTSDSDNDQTFITDSNGLAQYVFEGTDGQCGEDDTVTAVVRETVNSPVITTLVTHITFEKCAVQVSLEGKNSHNKKRDILTVNATSLGQLTGTPVHMMAKRHGHWVEVTPQADRVLNSAGKATFSVKDLNGNRITKYRAVIDEGDDTQRVRSQVLRRR